MTRGRRGFTLIEAVGAVVVMAVVTPGAFWAIRDAAERRGDPVLLNRARWLAAEKLEDVLADAANPSRGFAHVVPANYGEELHVPGYAGMSRRVVVSERGADLVSAGVGYKVVTVRVEYTGPRGRSRRYELAAVVVEVP